MSGYRGYTTPGTLSDRADYTNDPLDRPIKVVEDHSGVNTTTSLVYIGISDAISTETLTGATNTTKTYAYDPLGRRVTLSEGTHRYSYLQDQHGSVSMVIDQARVVQAAYGYSGYGNANSSLTKLAAGFAANTNVYQYSGKRWDSGSNTYDMGARRYSASSGRFLQRDWYDSALANLGLSEDPLSGNRYALAAGNPVNFAEIDGHSVARVTLSPAMFPRIVSLPAPRLRGRLSILLRAAAFIPTRVPPPCRNPDGTVPPRLSDCNKGSGVEDAAFRCLVGVVGGELVDELLKIWENPELSKREKWKLIRKLLAKTTLKAGTRLGVIGCLIGLAL